MVKFCSKCKKILPIGSAFCPTCGNQNLLQFCQNCKKIVPNSVKSCPTCGGWDAEASTSIQERVKPRKKKKRVFPVFIVLFLLIGAAIAAWWFFFSPVDKITLTPMAINLKEGENAVIECKLSPSWTCPFGVKWESTDAEIATVNQKGEVTALKKGECHIIVTARGTQKKRGVYVAKDGTDLVSIYEIIGGKAPYCQLAKDESYLIIDTNPENVREYYWSEIKGAPWELKYEADGMAYIVKANEALGLPSSITIKMGQTRALDGQQTETYGDIEVNWSYHPRHGLEVLYEVK